MKNFTFRITKMKIFPRHTRGKGFKGIKCNPATFTTFGKSGLAYPNEQ